MKIGQGDPSRTLQMESDGTWKVSFQVRQGTGEAFQYLGAYNSSNPQNGSRTAKLLKKMNPSRPGKDQIDQSAKFRGDFRMF
jgi:hypothetical protein